MLTTYAVLWVVRGLAELSNLALDSEFFRGDTPAWAAVTFGFALGVGALCVLAWVAGEVVAGYREPRPTIESGATEPE